LQMSKQDPKLRLGMIGGGPSSFIGPVHRMAARMSNSYELCATVLSSDAKKSTQLGIEMGMKSERAYPDWKAMIEREKSLPDGIEVLAIMTPNDLHYPIASAALDAGLHIICDKPLCNNLENAKILVHKTKEKQRVFCVTYNYSAYPMVRQARAMINNGDLGEIRQVHLEYIQSHMAESSPPYNWRFDSEKGGQSLVVGDIGTHAYHLGSYVTGLELDELMADLGSSIPGRSMDDYTSCLLRYENGARGSLWVTNAAAGAEHGLSFRIFGEKGGLEWHQENPNILRHRRLNGFEQIMTRRKDGKLYPTAEDSMRLVIGHPEGFHDAFANLYMEVAAEIRSLPQNINKVADEISFPTVVDGLKGVNFIYTIIASNKDRSWKNCRIK